MMIAQKGPKHTGNNNNNNNKCQMNTHAFLWTYISSCLMLRKYGDHCDQLYFIGVCVYLCCIMLYFCRTGYTRRSWRKANSSSATQ